MTAPEQTIEQLDFDIVPAHLAVKAMRDSGYRNAAYAIAELMDNSIQAGATSVELLCQETEIPIRQRIRSRIHRIAVLDNGSGMDEDVLRLALQFGNGTHLDDRSGMGRFGMGLPNASISQCKRVDVWTWQEGVESAMHSHIDIDDITAGKQREVPLPQLRSVPEFWTDAGRTFGESGTLVVWSKIDRCIWKTARSIIQNSEFIVGRMYRRFLSDDRVNIRLAAFTDESPSDPRIDRDAIPTDPLYLCTPSSCPAPYDDKSMFQEYGEPITMQVEYEGDVHEVTLKFSYALEEVRESDQAGKTKHGRHAARNVGVSVMRAGRELELEEAWTNTYDPRERWWGAEIEFPPALDEIFGVANNKQSARNLADVARLDLDELLDGRSLTELQEELAADEDPMGPLLDIAQRIKDTLQQIRRLIKAQARNQRAGHKKRWEDPASAEAVATSATKERMDSGLYGASDEDEKLPAAERTRDLTNELESTGLSRAEASELAASTVDHGLKYVFTQSGFESSAFFSVRPKAGTIVINLNTEHPAYEHLIETLEISSPDSDDVEELQDRLNGAAKGMRLLLAAWARFEDEAIGSARQELQDTRADWGRVARQFLT